MPLSDGNGAFAEREGGKKQKNEAGEEQVQPECRPSPGGAL